MQTRTNAKSLIHVVIISFEGPHNIIGGVQRRVSAEIAYFSDHNINLTVIYNGQGPTYVDGNVIYLPIKIPKLLYPVQTIIFSIKVAILLSKITTVDLIETHHDAGLAPLILHLLRKKPYKAWVEIIHGVFLDEFHTIKKSNPVLSGTVLRATALLLLSYIERWAACVADAVIVVSDYSKTKIIDLYSIPISKIHIVPNGFDTTVFCPSPKTMMSKKPEHGDQIKKILFVGRLEPRKGILILIRAFAKALQVYQSMELDIIGSGMQREEAQATCQKLNISNFVHFLGRKSDQEIANAYRSAYAVCMPSLQEGQGITALEAQACGTPVIASDAGGLPEAILAGKTGILVTSGDSESLSAAISEFVTNIEKRKQMGEYAQKWSQQYSWDTQLRKTDYLYRKLITLGKGN
jgi:glycosyltransferase involved in cell wall biosynthesis